MTRFVSLEGELESRKKPIHLSKSCKKQLSITGRRESHTSLETGYGATSQC
jgi:hypothetical protein